MQAENRSIFRIDRAVVGMLAAAVLLLQIVAVGFATGAMAEGGAFGVVCAADQTSSTSSDSAPLEKHVGPCCMLHCSSVAEVDEADAVIIVLSFDFPSAAPPVFDDRTAAVAPPELRSLSPRAPPARFA
ncbi:DUF4006 family protein [Methylosinus sp. H3A]|uniref:DUF4006 family protein n=1 Tax=Methylosinus sp. H3A TaxID=2785786 RepID=UPI0018C2A6ED|nr:DUF4006 family protein [Methylosinus sp. H3A]MBG0812263.1 DUF4006 family protein [Methylosinus sp. H3A]